MAKYQVSVLDRQGGSQEFELHAESTEDLDQKIAEQGWVVLRLRRVRERALKIKNEELILLCQHLRLILDAGLPVHEALSALAEESESRAMEKLCLSSAQRIDQGESLSVAFSVAKLDSFFLAMVRTGENTGRLPELLDRAASHLQWREDLKRSVVSSLSYPFLVLGSLAVVIPLLFIYLVPQLLGFLNAQHANLPWYTELLIEVAAFAQSQWHRVLGVVLSTISLVTLLWVFSQPFRGAWHSLLLKVPVLGVLVLQLKTAQVSEQLGIMYGAGIPVAEALPLVADSLNNHCLKGHLRETCRRLNQGESLHAALAPEVFPSLFLRLVRVGELSGKLDTTLAQSAELYSRHAHRRAEKLSAVIGPLALLFAGGLIIWLVAALILPLYDGLFSMGTGL